MAKVEVYSSAQCPYCVMAKQLLERKNVQYTDLRVDLDPTLRQEMIKKSQQRTVPQIFINDKAIGGYIDLLTIEREQRLDAMLA